MSGDRAALHGQVNRLLQWAALVEWCRRPLYPTWILEIDHEDAPATLEVAGLTFRAPRIPLLQIAIPVDPWPGLYLELKPKGERIAAARLRRHEDLRDAGYRVIVCEGVDDAMAEIRRYLGRGRHALIERHALKAAR